MQKNKYVSLLVGTLSALVLAFAAIPAAAVQVVQVYEIGGPPVFTGTGGPGSTLLVQAVLVDPANHSVVRGSKYEWCVIAGFTPQGHPLLTCYEVLAINGQGLLFAYGTLDEALLEAFQPQYLPVVFGTGAYANQTGWEVVQQVVFPNELLNTFYLY